LLRKYKGHHLIIHVQLWKQAGGYWEKEQLSALGLKIHLGHHGNTCNSPTSADMTILGLNSFHHVHVLFCGCSTESEERLEHNQLIAAGLFPATFQAPRTAFTFELLDYLVTFSGRGKSSTYDFHQALRSLTDACDLETWPVRMS
jgi:hypothetical protein